MRLQLDQQLGLVRPLCPTIIILAAVLSNYPRGICSGCLITLGDATSTSLLVLSPSAWDTVTRKLRDSHTVYLYDHEFSTTGGIWVRDVVASYWQNFSHAIATRYNIISNFCCRSISFTRSKVNARLKQQVDRLWHTTNIYMHPGIHEFAEKLTSKLPGDLKVSRKATDIVSS